LKLIKTCNTCGKTLHKPVVIKINCVAQCGKCNVNELKRKEKMYFLDEFLEGWK